MDSLDFVLFSRLCAVVSLMCCVVFVLFRLVCLLVSFVEGTWTMRVWERGMMMRVTARVRVKVKTGRV